METPKIIKKKPKTQTWLWVVVVILSVIVVLLLLSPNHSISPLYFGLVFLGLVIYFGVQYFMQQQKKQSVYDAVTDIIKQHFKSNGMNLNKTNTVTEEIAENTYLVEFLDTGLTFTYRDGVVKAYNIRKLSKRIQDIEKSQLMEALLKEQKSKQQIRDIARASGVKIEGLTDYEE